MTIETTAMIFGIVVCVMTTSIQGQPVAVWYCNYRKQDCLSEQVVPEQHRRWSWCLQQTRI